MRANEILSEISFGGKIPGLDEPILGQGSGAVVPGGAAMPAVSKAAADAAAATRAARQAQAAQSVTSQMVPKPPGPQVSFEPRTPAVWRRPEGRTAGGFDSSKSPLSKSDVERAEKFFGQRVDSELVDVYKKMRTSGQIPPNYTQTPSDAAKAADAKKTLGARVAGATLGGTVAGIGAGAYLGSKEQPATGTSTATPPPNDAWQAQPALGQAAASKAAADALKKAPPGDRTQIDELAPALIPALAGLGAAGLAGTAAYQMSKPSKPASGQPSSTAARPAAATTPAPAARPAAAATPTPAAPTSRPAAATSRPAGGPQQGVVGSELARLSGGEFATRADRLNQAKVDAILQGQLGLGPGYKAGSAAANRELRDYFRRRELGQEIFNRQMERQRQQGAGVATVRPAGGVTPTELLSRGEIPAPVGSSSGGTSSAGPAASSSGGTSSASPAASSSGDSSDNTVKSGTGLTWTDSSGNSIRTGMDETALQRLMTLSGQRH